MDIEMGLRPDKPSKKFKDCMDALINLDKGTYTKNIGTDTFKIIVTKSDCYYNTYVSVLKNDVEYYKYSFYHSNLGKENYSCECEVKFVEENYSLFITNNNQKIETDKVSIQHENNKYRLEYDALVDETDHKIYTINDSGISISNDSRSELEYDFETKKIYIYYKKYDRNEDYYTNINSVKFAVTDSLEKQISDYNLLLENALKEVSLNVREPQFKLLLASLKIPALNASFNEKAENLKKIIDIYNRYQPLINKYENEIYNEMYDFIMELYYNPEIAKINNFKNLVIEGDYTNPGTLKEIKKSVKSLQKNKIIKKLFRRSELN